MQIHEFGKFKYIETNPTGKDTLVLLHGLFGALSNFQGILNYFGTKYNVIVPILPITEMPILSASLGGLVDYMEDFMIKRELKDCHLLGNSLGGHIALLYTLRQMNNVKTLTLTGSSGLFEEAMGSSYPKRGAYDYIQKKTEDTFFNPNVATKDLVDEIFSTVNDRGKVLRILSTAKSAIRHNVSDKLHTITCPVLLIWGNQDKVTPPFVANKFHELLPNSELYFIDKCGHAPMMELPDEFNVLLDAFISKHL